MKSSVPKIFFAQYFGVRAAVKANNGHSPQSLILLQEPLSMTICCAVLYCAADRSCPFISISCFFSSGSIYTKRFDFFNAAIYRFIFFLHTRNPLSRRFFVRLHAVLTFSTLCFLHNKVPLLGFAKQPCRAQRPSFMRM